MFETVQRIIHNEHKSEDVSMNQEGQNFKCKSFPFILENHDDVISLNFTPSSKLLMSSADCPLISCTKCAKCARHSLHTTAIMLPSLIQMVGGSNL